MQWLTMCSSLNDNYSSEWAGQVHSRSGAERHGFSEEGEVSFLHHYNVILGFMVMTMTMMS